MSKSVEVRLSANVSGFTAGMSAAAAAAKQFTGSLPDKSTGFLGNINQHAAELNQLAGSMATIGAAGMAAFGGVAKTAVDWESAFAGVKKTVDDNAAGYAALSDELRGLARELPASHAEIAGVAEAAGQLGVAREDITAFTRTMIDLGETTNLSAADAAMGLARFSTIMGTSHADVDRLGSTIVGLGNNFATTESEILAMSMRLAGMGNQVGMTEADVMGIAAAMSSVGIEAEAGGTAMSLSMMKINDAVMNGGAKLDGFASTAGMSAEAFARAWRDDPAQALQAFIAGLGQVQAEGGNTSQVLRDLGIVNQRERDAMLRLAGASDTVAESLKMAGEEFAANSALGDEAALRYETAASQIRIAWNNIKDAAISAGAAFLPMIVSASEGVSSLAQAIGNLPPGVLSLVTGLTGLGGVLLLAGAGFIKLATSIAGAHQALGVLAAAFPRVGAAVSGLAATAGPLAAVAAAVIALKAANDATASYVVDGAEQMTEALLRLSETKTALDGAFQRDSFLQDWSESVNRADPLAWLNPNLQAAERTLAEATQRLFDPTTFQKIDDALFGWTGMGSAGKIADRFGEIDQALSSMVQGGQINEAANAFQQLRAEMKQNGATTEEVAATFTGYRSSLEQVVASMDPAIYTFAEIRKAQQMLAIANGDLAGSMSTLMGESGMQGIGGVVDAMNGHFDSAASAAEKAAAANNDLMASIFGVANAYLMMSGSLMGKEAAYDAAIQAAEQYGRTLDITTEAGRANQQALDNIVGATMNLADSWLEAGRSHEDVVAQVEDGKSKWLAAAEAMGMTDAAARELGASMGLQVNSVAELADALFQVPDVEVDFSEVGSDAVASAANAAKAAIDNVPVTKKTSFSESGSSAVRTAAQTTASAIAGVPTKRNTAFSESGSAHVAGWAGAVAAAVSTTPTRRNTNFSVSGTAAAISGAQSVARAIAAIPSSKTTYVRTVASGAAGAGAAAVARAGGGPIPGWSPHPRADNILVAATAGEFMHSVPTVELYGMDVMDAINRRLVDPARLRAVAGFADGGSVSATGGHRPIPATTWPTPQAAPTVHVAAPTLDGAILEIPVAPFVAALEKRDRSARVAARVALRGA